MTKIKKIQHTHVCDNCGKPATYNIQDGGYTLHSIDNDGDFEIEGEWGVGESTNEYYCDDCVPR